MFHNRKHAALLLAKALEKYRGEKVLIVGIPRGGIETAYYVAQHLQAKLSLIIVRKLGYPKNPEFAFGAMAEDGTVYYNTDQHIHISQEMMDEVEEKEQLEIEHRKRIFREKLLLPNIEGETVIIVDDGIATGATIIAAIKMCRKKGASKIIVAAPVCSKRAANEIQKEADDLVILERPKNFNAVSQFYKSFRNLTDEEALEILEKVIKENSITG